MHTAAVLLHDDNTAQTVLTAVAELHGSKCLRADAEVCRAFQTARLPMLVLYNADGVETARACGDLHVLDLIRQTSAQEA